MENRHGLVVDAHVTGTVEREARTKTTREGHCGGDALCQRHPPFISHRWSTARHDGYKTSQTIRKRIEKCFGWLESIGGLRKSRFVGREKLDFHFMLGAATC
ncbi:hypothetical protein [Thiolapillus sp.]